MLNQPGGNLGQIVVVGTTVGSEDAASAAEAARQAGILEQRNAQHQAGQRAPLV